MIEQAEQAAACSDSLSPSAGAPAALLPEDRLRLRGRAKRTGIRRAALLAMCLPLAVGAAGVGIAIAVEHPEEVVLGLFSIVGCLVTLGYALREIWLTFRNDPMLISGAVLGRPTFESEEPSLTGWLYSRLFGRELKLDIDRRVRIRGDGSLADRRELLGEQEVSVTRRVHKAVSSRRRVVMLLTPGERGIAVLDELPDDPADDGP